MPHRRDVPAFSEFLYEDCNRVERFLNKIKYSRAVATRFDEDPGNDHASVKLAAIRIGLRSNEATT